MIITSPSFSHTSRKSMQRSLVFAWISLSRDSRSSARQPSIPAAASNSASRASSAATRTAGPTDAVVIEPHEFDANGRRSVSPSTVRTSSSLRAEHFGGDLRHHRSRAGAEVLRAREHLDRAVAVDAHRRVRRRSAARAPRERRHPDAAPHRAVASRSSRSRRVPPEALGAERVALVEMLAEYAALLVLIVVGVVAAAQLERIHARARAPARPSRTRGRTRPRRGPARETTPSRAVCVYTNVSGVRTFAQRYISW